MLTNIQHWSFYPLVFAIAATVHKQFFTKKDTSKFYRLYYIMILLSFLIIVFNPIPSQEYAALLAISISIEVLIIAGYIYLKNRELSDLLFFLGLLFYLNGGYTLSIASYEVSIVFFFVGNLFIALVLNLPKIALGEKQSDIAKIFNLKKQLAETKSALNEREKTFYTLFNQMADPVMILNKKGKFLELTDKVKEYTGFEKTEILGKNFLRTKLLTPKSKAVCIKNLGKRMAGISVKPYEVEALTKDGKKIPFEVNAQQILYEGKKADLVVFRDISERKKAEKDQKDYLENSLFLSKTVIELNKTKTPEHVYDYIGASIQKLTKNDAYVFITRFDETNLKFKLYKIYGQGTNWKKLIDVLGLNLEKRKIYFDTDSNWLKKIRSGNLIKIASGEINDLLGPSLGFGFTQLIKKLVNLDEIYTLGIIRSGEFFGTVSLVARKGKKIENLDIIQIFVNQAAVALQRNVIMQELTELNRNLENNVNQRTERIRQLLKQKDEFISQLGHDLKNPLNPLVNLLPILERDEKDAKRKEMFKVINRNVGYMKNLVKKTLDLAKLNSPTTQLNFEPLNLSYEFDKVLDRNKFKLQEKQLKVNTDISKNLKVSVDKLYFEELVNNLVDNAVKFSPRGGTINIDATESEKDIKVIISDEGTGMTKNQISHIFDEFYKADSSRHNFDSSGLGMSICKRVAEKHGGRIWAESKGLGKGSKFIFSLPKIEDPSSTDHMYVKKDISAEVDRILERFKF
jgi:PAS domain S-box-containing protein